MTSIFPYDGRYDGDYDTVSFDNGLYVCVEITGAPLGTPVHFSIPPGPGYGGAEINTTTGSGTGFADLARFGGWAGPPGNHETHTYEIVASTPDGDLTLEFTWHHKPDVGFGPYGAIPILLEGTLDTSGFVSLHWTPQPFSYQNLPFRRISYSVYSRPHPPPGSSDDPPWTPIAFPGASLSYIDGPITVPTEYRVLGQEPIIDESAYSNVFVPVAPPPETAPVMSWGVIAR